MPCSTKPRVDFILTLPEFYAIKLSKKHFDLCSKLTLIDVFGHMSRFHNFNCNLYLKDRIITGKQNKLSLHDLHKLLN